jgi:hypothetical protein
VELIRVGRLGKALRALGRDAEAIHAYELPITHGFAPSILWWDMGLSAIEVEDADCLERLPRAASSGPELATKLRRRRRCLKAKQPASVPQAEAPEADGGLACAAGSIGARI